MTYRVNSPKCCPFDLLNNLSLTKLHPLFLDKLSLLNLLFFHLLEASFTVAISHASSELWSLIFLFIFLLCSSIIISISRKCLKANDLIYGNIKSQRRVASANSDVSLWALISEHLLYHNKQTTCQSTVTVALSSLRKSAKASRCYFSSYLWAFNVQLAHLGSELRQTHCVTKRVLSTDCNVIMENAMSQNRGPSVFRILSLFPPAF